MTAPPAPARVLSARDTWCVVVGAIIGVGIFFTPSSVAAMTGGRGLSLLAWGLGGVIALLGALCFAELGGMYPHAGGQYPVLRDAWGAPCAFTYGFCLVTAIQAGACAIIGIICARHVGLAVCGTAPTGWVTVLLAALMIVSLSAANVRGVRCGVRIQNITVYAKLATLVLVSVLAAWLGQEGQGAASKSPAGTDQGPLLALFAALTPVLFSYGGWQQGLWMAGEVRAARRVLPRAMVAGVAVVVAVYLGMVWACFRLLGQQGVATSQALAADAVQAVLGPWGGRGVAAAVAVSAFGVMNAQLLTGPRYIFAMARDGRFFAPFKVLHPRFGTPARAVLLLGALSLLLLLGAGEGGVDHLLTGVVLIDWVFFGLTGAALLVLRRKRPQATRSVLVPGYPWVPLLFVLAALAAIAGSLLDADRRPDAIFGVAWIVAAALTYVVFFRSARRSEQKS